MMHPSTVGFLHRCDYIYGDTPVNPTHHFHLTWWAYPTHGYVLNSWWPAQCCHKHNIKWGKENTGHGRVCGQAGPGKGGGARIQHLDQILNTCPGPNWSLSVLVRFGLLLHYPVRGINPSPGWIWGRLVSHPFHLRMRIVPSMSLKYEHLRKSSKQNWNLACFVFLPDMQLPLPCDLLKGVLSLVGPRHNW